MWARNPHLQTHVQDYAMVLCHINGFMNSNITKFTAALVLTVFTSWSASAANDEAVAIFAGGCFWCVESDFDRVPGVTKTISGYTGGTLKNPTYKDVVGGGTGHREAVQIFYDPGKVTYAILLEVFWRSVDPTDADGQFCDRGVSYETAIFVTSLDQHRLAEASKKALMSSGALKKPVVTRIEDATDFYPAEAYHQDFYEKNPVRYRFYRYNCGRDQRVKELWGDQAYKGIIKH